MNQKTTDKKRGRPKNSGKYGLPTILIRIPSHLKNEVVEFIKGKLNL